MSDDDFYEEDEPIEDIIAAWNRGEKGVTSGPRDLDQQGREIIYRAVMRIEGEREVSLRVVESGTNVTTFREWVSL